MKIVDRLDALMTERLEDFERIVVAVFGLVLVGLIVAEVMARF